jgi:alkyl hydroperoxide reductase subunit AhpC
MSLRLGDAAPNFQATTTNGPLDFHEYLGDSWGVLFSHPADYTPVCTTELGRTAQLADEFARRNVKVMAVSVDPLDKHQGWVSDINETQGTTVNFPIVADKKVKLTITYPASTGRNFVEVLRVIDSLQLTAKHSVATPADWKQGEDVIVVPAVSTADAEKKFPKGLRIVKPYLRYTPQPE